MSLLIPNNKPLPVQIEIAENALSEAFARDLITMEEFEKRIHKVQEAGSNSDISSCFEDLPNDLLSSASDTETPKKDIENRKKIQTTILSSNLLCGGKLKQKDINAKVILGEQVIDYSKTILEPGRYIINLTVVLGETKIIVPPEYSVSSDISNILSEVKNKTYKSPDSGTPEIIITGKAVLSSVSIKESGSGFIEKIKKLFLD